MAAGPKGLEEWVGSAYLFVESSLDKVVLSDAYAHPQQKVEVYRALRTALAGAWLSGPLERKGPTLGLFVGGARADTQPLQLCGPVLNYCFREDLMGRIGGGQLVSLAVFSVTYVCPWV